jgi:sugar/nucleoside kinase (ribokinase family)
VPAVAVVGNVSRDVVDGGSPTPGGCPCFAADAFRLLGCGGQIVTRFRAEDEQFFRSALTVPGVSVATLPAGATSGFSLDYAGEMRSMGVTAIGERWRPEDARALAADVRWVHAAPLLRSDFPPETLARLAAGRRLSLDGQGLVRRPALGPLVLDAAYEPGLLEHVTAVKLSEEEARVVAGGAFDRRAAARLAVAEVLVTRGSRGTVVFAGGAERFVAAPRQLVDVQTTGAGDAFMVGYAAARADGADPVEAAHRASGLVADLLAERT